MTEMTFTVANVTGNYWPEHTTDSSPILTAGAISTAETSGSVDNACNQTDSDWYMPIGVLLTTMIVLTCELFFSILTNLALVLTIYNSPGLRSPPNVHLVNICATNLLLTCGMLFEVASTICSGHGGTCCRFVAASGALQMMIDVTVFVQYWSIFSAIGVYRCQTIRKPLMSVAARRSFIYQSIGVGWFVSLIIGASVTLTFHGTGSVVGWNAFRKTIHGAEVGYLEMPLNPSQIISLSALALSISVNCVVICKSYFCMLRTLLRFCPPARRSWCRTIDITVSAHWRSASVHPWPPNTSTVADKNMAVHYCTNQTRPAGDVFTTVDYSTRVSSGSLQMKSASIDSSPMECFAAVPSLADDARPDSGSSELAEFTDISPGAELHRVQMLKNNWALKNQSWRRDRISLTSATKNSVVMISTFVVCSFPLLFCSIPGVLDTSSISAIHYPLIFSHLAFNVNAPAYPVWYLIFSKRVRKCFQHLYEDVLIKLNMR